VPDRKQHPYEHQPPHRPSHLPYRSDPPPERKGAPDMRLAIYVGLVLLAIVAFFAIPYLIQYLLLWITGG
jgi:hypothetical protein